MEQLPPELMQIICSFLQPVPDLLRLSRVSRRWYASCASASLWRHVTVSSSAFPSSSERRSAWNRFAKRLGRAVSELHITLPRTLRLSEHHHPLTRSSFARCAGLREICSVCQNYLGDAFYVCKIPACVWTECEECRLNASLPLSLSSFASLSSLTVRRPLHPVCLRSAHIATSLIATGRGAGAYHAADSRCKKRRCGTISRFSNCVRC